MSACMRISRTSKSGPPASGTTGSICSSIRCRNSKRSPSRAANLRRSPRSAPASPTAGAWQKARAARYDFNEAEIKPYLQLENMIDAAFHRLHFHDGILFIENVGNLVCPAGFDLGEAHKVVIASVTEGEDKPLKYPNMFAAASLMLVSKVDLLPHLDFDVDLLIANARRVNPAIAVIKVSATSGEGIDRWLQWLSAARDMALASA